MFVSCVKTCDGIRLDEGSRTYVERWPGPCTIKRLMEDEDVEVGGFGEVKGEFSPVARYVFKQMLTLHRRLEPKDAVQAIVTDYDCVVVAFRNPGVFLCADVIDEDVVRILATQEKGEE